MGKGAIVIQSQVGKARAATCEILGASSLAEMVALADGLKSYTCGKIISVSYTESVVYTADDYITGKKDSVVNDKMLMAFLHNSPSTGQGPSMTIKWPAPVNEMLDYQKAGVLCVDAQGDSIAAILSARLADVDVDFNGGKMNK
jgi:hypothetical protein